MKYLLRFPWPNPNLSGHAKGHWRRKAAATKVARGEAFFIARSHQIRTPMPDATLRLTFHPPDNRRRDCHNVGHMCKAYIDGIADAMGCDDNGFEVHFPARFAEVISGGCVLIEVDPSTVILPMVGSING